MLLSVNYLLQKNKKKIGQKKRKTEDFIPGCLLSPRMIVVERYLESYTIYLN